MEYKFGDDSSKMNCSSQNVEIPQATETAEVVVVSKKSKTIALLLCFFFGSLGLHQFYVGKNKIGFLYVFTLGFFGIAQIVNLVRLCLNKFTDSQGAVLRKWELD